MSPSARVNGAIGIDNQLRAFDEGRDFVYAIDRPRMDGTECIGPEERTKGE